MNSEYAYQYRFLADRDPVLAHLVEEYGHPDPFDGVSKQARKQEREQEHGPA